MSTFQYILPALIAVAAIILAFTRRMPAAAIAFVAMVLARAFGWGMFTSGTLWFWGIAMVIATGIQYLSPIPPLRSLRMYIVGGTLVGCVLGALLGTMAGLIIAGIAGAALGFIAFRRTPDGKMNAGLSLTLSIFADVALPAAIAFFISTITLAQLPLFQSV